MAEWKVPLFDLDLGEGEYESVQGVLASNWLTMGRVTEDFEAAFAEYLGVRHAIAVSSASTIAIGEIRMVYGSRLIYGSGSNQMHSPAIAMDYHQDCQHGQPGG